ncbi:MAG: DeoR/GlpR family DNA-binding transcription regulator [Planctomycetota bacterium]|nr:DeoR/GlpR family DNA-binding transcription regulator [Planctomycetota bacterium]
MKLSSLVSTEKTKLTDIRRSKLLEFVRTKGFAATQELFRIVEGSESTIRRDLEFFENLGEIKRTHGGVFYTGGEPKLPHFERSQSQNIEKKREIARAAANLVEEGDTILLDGGSTTFELAQQLAGRQLQVVTNSLPVSNLFIANHEADLVVLGGNVHLRTGTTIGPYASQMLAELNCRVAFLSVAGIHEDGFYNSNFLLVETEKAMMNAADEVVIIADSTKFGKKSLARLCELSSVDKLVVDSDIDDDWKKRITDSGVKLFVSGGND